MYSTQKITSNPKVKLLAPALSAINIDLYGLLTKLQTNWDHELTDFEIEYTLGTMSVFLSPNVPQDVKSSFLLGIENCTSFSDLRALYESLPTSVRASSSKLQLDIEEDIANSIKTNSPILSLVYSKEKVTRNFFSNASSVITDPLSNNKKYVISAGILLASTYIVYRIVR